MRVNRRSESLGIIAVAVLVLGLLAFQFLPGSDTDETSIVVSEQDRVETQVLLDDVDRSDVTSTEIIYDRTIAVEDLPPEAIDTLLLIDDDGPYPYRKDGSTFQNREGRLPDRARGHYREFTVETPGSSDRGARRIVAGDDGELYWTADHYDSFAQIVGW